MAVAKKSVVDFNTPIIYLRVGLALRHSYTGCFRPWHVSKGENPMDDLQWAGHIRLPILHRVPE